MFPNKETIDNETQFYNPNNPEFVAFKNSNSNFFQLYRLNPKNNQYDWTESKHTSLEECEEEAKKLMSI